MKCIVPYTTNYSKNKKYYMSKTPTSRIITASYRQATRVLSTIFNQTFKGHTFLDKHKTWVKIYAYRPDFKSDIHNFEECICDSLKDAIGIDDRYFSLIIDWCLDIEKINPRIEIEVWQVEGEHVSRAKKTNRRRRIKNDSK
jgi:hypothetical protein